MRKGDTGDRVDIADYIDRGWLHFRSMIEVQGNHKDTIQKAIDNMVERLEKEKFILVISDSQDDVKAIKEGWFSTNLDLEVLAKGYENAMRFAIHYSPSTMEILSPKEIRLKTNELQGSLLEVSGLLNTFAHAAYLARRQLQQVQPQDKGAGEGRAGSSPPTVQPKPQVQDKAPEEKPAKKARKKKTKR